MSVDGERELLSAAGASLSESRRDMLVELVRFVDGRLVAAATTRQRIGEQLSCPASVEALQRETHAFLRECWDVLDGLGRQVNLCLHPLFPETKLWPPERMTRQCTFYTVRRALHRSPQAAAHPLSALLWEETRSRPAPAYVRLSFLYNVSLFVPIPLPACRRLPGSAELPEHVRGLVKPGDVEGCPIEAGLDEIISWLGGFAGRCYRIMTEVLTELGRG